MNIYRLSGDSLHLLSILFLTINIRQRRSVAGISFKTQGLYALVYMTRYLDLLWCWNSTYNVLMKIFFIVSSLSILHLIKRSYKTTHDEALDTFKIEYLFLVSIGAALLFNYELSLHEVSWSFTIWLESLAILPQLSIIPKTSEVENISTHYIVLLQGSYRALYILNWIYRYTYEHVLDPIPIIGAVIQVGLSAWALQRVLVIHVDSKGSSMPTIAPRISQHVLFFLRWMQLGATTINGYIFCYLVWSHNNHYCAWHPQSCTLEQKESAQVPWQFILMITVCVTAFLESYISSARVLYSKKSPKCFDLICTTATVALFYSVAYFAVVDIPGLTNICYFNSIPQDLKANVEERLCTLVVDARVVTGIAFGLTLGISLLSVTTMVYELNKRTRIMLEDEDTENCTQAKLSLVGV